MKNIFINLIIIEFIYTNILNRGLISLENTIILSFSRKYNGFCPYLSLAKIFHHHLLITKKLNIPFNFFIKLLLFSLFKVTQK